MSNFYICPDCNLNRVYPLDVCVYGYNNIYIHFQFDYQASKLYTKHINQFKFCNERFFDASPHAHKTELATSTLSSSRRGHAGDLVTWRRGADATQ